jgi:hypothetical protein
VSALALAPPRSSVLLPGPGNQAEKAGKTEYKGAKKTEKGYVIGQTQFIERHLHAAAIPRHDDGHLALIPTIEQAQLRLPRSAEVSTADVGAV